MLSVKLRAGGIRRKIHLSAKSIFISKQKYPVYHKFTNTWKNQSWQTRLRLEGQTRLH